MTGTELVNRYAIRERLSDAMETGYTEAEIVSYINDAINMIWHVMIKKEMPEVIGDMEVTDNCDKKRYQNRLPPDFYRATSKVPMVVHKYGTKSTFDWYGDKPYHFRYYRVPPMIESLDDELPPEYPFSNPALLNIIAQMVISMAFNNHGFDTNTEQDFTTAIMQMLI